MTRDVTNYGMAVKVSGFVLNLPFSVDVGMVIFPYLGSQFPQLCDERVGQDLFQTQLRRLGIWQCVIGKPTGGRHLHKRQLRTKQSWFGLANLFTRTQNAGCRNSHVGRWRPEPYRRCQAPPLPGSEPRPREDPALPFPGASGVLGGSGLRKALAAG